MPGYVIALSDRRDLEACVHRGVYGTLLKDEPDGRWKDWQERTFADFAGMRPGDNVYFFSNRKLYGIGVLKDVGFDCKYQNFPGATTLTAPAEYVQVQPSLLLDDGPDSARIRWICTFSPAPHFFAQGVDMDDALASAPGSFRVLRAFEGRSFIKIDDEENRALRDAILRWNRGADERSGVLPHDAGKFHARIASVISPGYALNAGPLMRLCAESGKLRHEAALEAGLVYQLSQRDAGTLAVFGCWDFVSHQVTASPPKPPRYMDWMDVFGYTYLPGLAPTVDHYSVIEAKLDTAGPDVIEQAMKYADWLNQEYCHGDFGMVRAFVVAAKFTPAALEAAEKRAVRLYTVGRRPPETREWRELKLIKYRFDHSTERLTFEPVYPN